jgi:hypothetical protein
VEVDHNRTWFALAVGNFQLRTVTRLELGEQRERVVVIAETHGFASLQCVKRTEDCRMAEALGDAAGIEGVDRLGGGVIAGMNGLHLISSLVMPEWHWRPFCDFARAHSLMRIGKPLSGTGKYGARAGGGLAGV